MRLLLTTLACLAFGIASAQSSIKGFVLNDQNSRPITGASATLLDLIDSTTLIRSTDRSGVFLFEGIPDGNYLLTVTAVGLERYENAFSLKDTSIVLKDIRLGDEPIILTGVEIKASQIQAVQLGDTTQFNAAAFKTNPDASAEDLVGKLPGVVNNNGQIEVQGEQLNRVLVDGRPFFGNDPNAALKNLPADVIDKIQVFDQKSDQATFTGFDDGETTKTLNIITKVDARTGQFGKAYAGYGTEEHYQAGLSFNWRDDDIRISLIGQSNNINNQNFATEDLVGALGISSSGMRGGGRGRRGRRGGGGGGVSTDVNDFLINASNGVTTTHALGLNYVDDWGKKTQVSSSYFFNYGDNVLEQTLERTYVVPEFEGQQYLENSDASSDNINHRFNLRLESKLDSFNSIVFTPSLSMQFNDGLSNQLGVATQERAAISSTDNQVRSSLSGLNYNSDLLFRHAFRTRGRTLSVNFNNGYNENRGDASQLAVNEALDNDPVLIDSLDQQSDLQLDGWTLHPRVSYTEPIGEKNQLEISAGNAYQKSNSDRKTNSFDPDTQDYTQLDTLLTNVFDNVYNRSYAGVGFRRRDGDLSWNLNLNVQNAILRSEEIFPVEDEVNRDFFNLLPYAGLRYRFTKTENIRFNYRTSTSSPGVDQLQNVFDISNPLAVSVGNPGLKQQYQHNFVARYSNINTAESRVFFAMLRGSFANDYIANSSFLIQEDTIVGNDYLLTQGAQLSTPVNLDGQWNGRAFATYGFPLKAIKSNLNFNTSIDLSRLPSIINSQENYAFTQGYGVGAALTSNISENIDFTLSSRTSYNNTSNSLPGNADNQFWNQTTRLRLNLIVWEHFVLRTDLNHQANTGLGEDFNQNYTLWNAGIAYKFMRNNMAEVQLSIYDILQQNNSISRNVTETYFEDNISNVLQQYLMLTFTYRFRNFGNQPAPQQERGAPGFGGGGMGF